MSILLTLKVHHQKYKVSNTAVSFIHGMIDLLQQLLKKIKQTSFCLETLTNFLT